jgi:hypothetical protein
MGWDVYRQDECELVMATNFKGEDPRLRWLPKWPGNNTLVEDAPTMADARKQIRELHLSILGVQECFAPRRMDA